MMELVIDKTVYNLPSSWKEIPYRKKKKLVRKSKYNAPDMQVTLLRLFLPFKIFFRLRPYQLEDILKHFDWLYESTPDPIISSFFGGRILNGESRWETGTAREFVLADQYYKKFLKTGKPIHLNRLCAVICRKKASRKQSIINEDRRIKIQSRKQAELNAWIFRFVPYWKKISVLSYFAGCKQYIDELYSTTVFKSSEEASTGGGIDFGWNGFLMSIAEGGIFGNFEQVIDTRLHTILFYAAKKLQEQAVSNTSNTET